MLEPFQCPFEPATTFGTPSRLKFPNEGVPLDETHCLLGSACVVPYGVLLLPSMGDAGLGRSFSIGFDVEFFHLAAQTAGEEQTIMMSVFANDPDEVIQVRAL